MASRTVIIASLLGASVGVPYLASQSKNKTAMPSSVSSSSASTPASYANYSSYSNVPNSRATSMSGSPSSAWSASNVATSTSWSPPYQMGTSNTLAAMPVSMASGGSITRLPTTFVPGSQVGMGSAVDGAQFTSAAQVLRFDVTKEWVCQNWTRKSTGPTDVGLLAIRVPLVMGTQMTSLVGSLTYFFDDRGQVQHISFHGKTGDSTPLVQMLTQTYKFQQVPPPAGERVFEVRDGDGLHSELRLRPEAVLNSSTPQQSVVVELELARPGSARVLPPREPPLQIPQVPGPPAAAQQQAQSSAESASGVSSSVQSAASNYWDQVRYATPDEYGLLRSKRWPQ